MQIFDNAELLPIIANNAVLGSYVLRCDAGGFFGLGGRWDAQVT